MPALLEDYRNYVNSLATTFGLSMPTPKTVIILSTVSFSDSYFATGGDGWDLLALGSWKRHMAPPSIVEFFLSYTVRFAIDSACGDNIPERHFETKGCVFDFSSTLSNSRYSVMTGYLCKNCEDHIVRKTSAAFIEDAKILLEKKWLGSIESPSDISKTAKKFGFDLFHTTGVKPSLWERAKAILEDKLFDNMIKLVFALLIAALLAKLNLS